MPIYEVGEHELLKEDTSMILVDEEISSGTLYLSDKRVIYEKKGKRGFLKATSAKTLLDVHLYDITNIATAVPKLRVMTRRTITIEYEKDGKRESARFEVNKPKEWETTLRRWIEDSKRLHSDELKRVEEEKHRRDVEMARAKAGTTNVGMVQVDLGKRGGNFSGIVDGEEIINNETVSGAIEPVRSSVPMTEPARCKKCGEHLDSDAVFCPSCGNRV